MSVRTRRRAARGAVAATLMGGLLLAATPADAAVSAVATPTTALVDGSVVDVTVTATGVGELVYVIQCSRFSDTSGSGCDFATLQTREVTSSDPFLVEITVKRHINTAQGTIDCSDEPRNCVIAVASLGPVIDFVTVPLEFVPPLPGAIEGVVTGPGGEPVAGAEVELDCFGTCGSATTDSTGHYRIDGLERGHVDVRVTPPSTSAYVPVPWSPDLQPLEAVIDEGSTTELDVELEIGARVAFTLLANGAPTAIDVGTLCNVDFPFGCIYPDEFEIGRYEFRNAVPPGPYSLVAFAVVVPGEPASVEFDAVAGDEFDFDLVVTRSVLRGVVTRSDTGAPIGDVSIQADCATCSAEYAATEPDGSYELGLQPGREYVVSFAPPYGTPLTTGSATVTLAADEVRSVDVALDPAPALVIDVPGEDVLTVDVCRVGAPPCWYSVVGRGGHLEIGPIAAGRYDVRVRAPRAVGAATAILADVEVPAGGMTISPTLRADGDFDGMANADEAGDHDGDGVDDAGSGLVMSRPGAAGGWFTVRRLTGGFSPLRFMSLRNPALVTEPVGIDFPDGVLTGRLDQAGNVPLQIDLPHEPEALYLRTASGGWERVDGGGLTGVTLDGTRAVVRLFDGSRYDLDPAGARVLFDLAPGTDGVPGAQIVDGPVGFVTSTSADFTVDVPPGSTVQCSLDLGPFEPCDATPSYSGLSTTTHVLVVQSITGGRPGPSDFRVWYAGAPVGPRLIGGPLGVTAQRSASFGTSGVITRCFVDMARFVDCGAGLDLLGLRVGPHVVVAFAGNEIVDLRYWVVHRPVAGT